MEVPLMNKASLSVFEKLSSLKQWQSEQHEKLARDQEKNRERLVEEQNQRFQNLNIIDEHSEQSSLYSEEDVSRMDKSLVSASDESNFKVDDKRDSHERSFTSIHESETQVPDGGRKKIFPFLKRGKGLTRFRMTPEDMQAQKRRISAIKPRKKEVTEQKQPEKEPVKSKPEVPRKTLGHVNENLAHSRKVHVPRAPIPPTLKLVPPKKPPVPVQQKRKVPPKFSGKELQTRSTRLPENSSYKENTNQANVVKFTKGLWKNSLETPTEVRTSSPLRKVEQRELRVFERLEKLVDESSFCSTSSVITRFVEAGYISSVQTTPYSSPVKGPGQYPLDLESPSMSPNPTVENAKALLKELAALKFGPPHSQGHIGEFWKNNPDLNINDLKLDLSSLKSGMSSDEDDMPQKLGLSEDEWSKTSDSSADDSGSETSEDAKSLIPSGRESANLQTLPDESASSGFSTDGDDTASVNGGLRMGTVMHARLEQLQKEVMVVQEQQAHLTCQRSELSAEKERLARAIEEAETQKRKYAGSKLQQQKENSKIEELKNQLEELQTVWKEKEVRWASAQASQRAQLRQLAQENKNLALQIKELKLTQGKKVHFAKYESKLPPKSALKKNEAEPQKSVEEEPNLNPTVNNQNKRITCAKDLDDALALYQRLCPKEASPNSSLCTPKSINKAYFDIFKSGELNLTDATATPAVVYEKKESRASLEGLEKLRQPMWSKTVLPEVNSSEKVRTLPADQLKQPSAVTENTTSVNILKNCVHPDGTRQIWYSSGNTLKVSADGANRRMIFYNGDMQESWNREGIARYFYAESKVWHETHGNGDQIISYPDGQKEVLKADGSKEVSFPDGSSMCIASDGKQTANLSDGSRLFLNLDGSSVLEMPNGLREVRTADSTTLQYPDGTVRVQFPSGLLETKYPNGRVRVKDASGKLIMDTHCPIDS